MKHIFGLLLFMVSQIMIAQKGEVIVKVIPNNNSFEIGEQLKLHVIVVGVSNKLRSKVIVAVNNDTILYNANSQEVVYTQRTMTLGDSLKWDVAIQYPISKKEVVHQTFSGYYRVKSKQISKYSALVIYKGCKNAIDFPLNTCDGGTANNIKATGATILKREYNHLEFEPTAPFVSFSLQDSDTTMHRQKIKVARIPSPEVFLKADGRRISKNMLSRGINLKELPYKVEVVVKFSDGFSNAHLEDSKLRIYKMDVVCVRDKRPVKTLHLRNGTFAPRSLNPEPGDRFIVEIIKVKRTKYDGTHPNMRLRNRLLTIPVK